jgi:hypothetical protein
MTIGKSLQEEKAGVKAATAFSIDGLRTDACAAPMPIATVEHLETTPA